MSAEVDLFTGLAGILTDADVAVFNDTLAYGPTDAAITMGDLPQLPAEVVVLTPYPVQDDAKLNDSIIAVQVMLRGTTDPRSVKNRSGAIFDLFQGLEDRDFGSIHLALMWRQSGRLDGKDDLQRWLSVENYYCRVNWPTTYRTE